MPEVEVTVNEFTQAHALGQGGRKEQPSIVDQAVVVEGYLYAVGVQSSGSSSVGCSLFLVGFLSRKPLSQMQRSTFWSLQDPAARPPSVDSGLDLSAHVTAIPVFIRSLSHSPAPNRSSQVGLIANTSPLSNSTK